MAAAARCRTGSGCVLAIALSLASSVRAQEVNLGHKIVGALGLNAGMQPSPGVYLGARAVGYAASELLDRDGNPVPVGFNAEGVGGGLGIAGTYELAPLSTYVNVSIAMSGAHISLTTVRPEASTDRAGLGDLFVQPMGLGWRLPQADIVVAYAFYAPTGRTEPGASGSGIGRAQWTHEASIGGAVYFDRRKTWYASALTSLDVNTKKRDIDITRGATIQVQGGAGTTLRRFFDVGVAFYALWQVSDDRGADLPAALRGARDRTYGLGPEIGMLIPAIRSRLTMRYVHDFAGEARPLGQLLILGLTFAAWLPPPRADRARP